MTMSWYRSEPPVDPPGLSRGDCEECGGTGEIIRASNEPSPQTIITDCPECDGRGRWEPEDFQPDTWKEAEGIA